MNSDTLDKIVEQIAIVGRGVLAADESNQSIPKKFDTIGLENTEENRRRYRELLFTAPLVEKYISGVILYEETLRQSTSDNVRFTDLLTQRGMTPGIKVDKGLVDTGDEQQLTQGLEDLPVRLEDYKQWGPKFTKWRSVFKITATTPTDDIIGRNTQDLARYAKIVQEAGLVPIVEPEVLIDGDHTIEKSYEVIEKVLTKLFEALKQENVYLPGIFLKPSMVTSGSTATPQADINVSADMTVQALKATVPTEVPCICFLSGGQSDHDATAHLNAMVKNHPNLPWYLTFSFGRGLQDIVISTWQGNDENKDAAQKAFLKKAEENALATEGKYTE